MTGNAGRLGFNADSVILLIGSEGATDADIYAQHIIRIERMTTPIRGFGDAEPPAVPMQAAVTRADVGALLLTSEAEIRYFTGFMTQFWQVNPAMVCRYSVIRQTCRDHSIDWRPLMRQCYTENIISWASPAALDDGITLVADVIRQHVKKGGRLGILMGRETAVRMPLADLFALQQE